MTGNEEMEVMLQKMVLDHFNVLYQDVTGCADENHEKPLQLVTSVILNTRKAAPRRTSFGLLVN